MTNLLVDLKSCMNLRIARKATQSILLLGSSKDDLILKAFRAGARGLFSENDPLELLSECVRSVHQGKVWANPHAFGVAVEALASSPNVRTSDANGMKLLSKREMQVVRSLAEGLTNREIAEQLKLSPHTIKNYLFRIFDKLGVSSRIELLFMSLSQPRPFPPRARSRLKSSVDTAIPTTRWSGWRGRRRRACRPHNSLLPSSTSFGGETLKISSMPTCGISSLRNAQCSHAD